MAQPTSLDNGKFYTITSNQKLQVVTESNGDTTIKVVSKENEPQTSFIVEELNSF